MSLPTPEQMHHAHTRALRRTDATAGDIRRHVADCLGCSTWEAQRAKIDYGPIYTAGQRVVIFDGREGRVIRRYNQRSTGKRFWIVSLDSMPDPVMLKPADLRAVDA